MKRNKLSILCTLLLLSVLSIKSKASPSGVKDMDTVRIQTSAVCEMCQDRIESAMAYEKGVSSSTLNLKTKILTVVYRHGKTDEAKIRAAVAATGYHADEVRRDAKGYSRLPSCCQKAEAGCK